MVRVRQQFRLGSISIRGRHWIFICNYHWKKKILRLIWDCFNWPLEQNSVRYHEKVTPWSWDMVFKSWVKEDRYQYVLWKIKSCLQLHNASLLSIILIWIKLILHYMCMLQEIKSVITIEINFGDWLLPNVSHFGVKEFRQQSWQQVKTTFCTMRFTDSAQHNILLWSDKIFFLIMIKYYCKVYYKLLRKGVNIIAW